MSLDNPLTITDVFRRHGIGTAIIAPVLQLQELALAVSLQGRYQVHLDYHGGAHRVRMTVREAATDTENRQGLESQLALVDIPLPHEGRPAGEACHQLGAAADRLHHYLREGQPS